MNFELYVIYNTTLIYSYIHGKSFFSDEQRVLATGFLSALDSFSNTAMKSQIEMIQFSNSNIFFKRSNGALYVMLFPSYKKPKNLNKFFDKFIAETQKILNIKSVIPTKENEEKIDSVLNKLKDIIE